MEDEEVPFDDEFNDVESTTDEDEDDEDADGPKVRAENRVSFLR